MEIITELLQDILSELQEINEKLDNVSDGASLEDLNAKLDLILFKMD